MTTEKSQTWGWAALLILLGYAFFVHQGMGIPQGGGMGVWWDPRYPTTTFLTWPIWGQLEQLLGYEDAEYTETWRIHAFVILIPAVLLAACVIGGTRSAVARALAFTSVISILLFVACGFAADGMWKLFHWRISVLMVAIAAALGFTLASPWLAASWLRLNGLLRWVIYLPLLLALIILFRHTTGWDPNLMMNLSPWPALPTFGLGIGVWMILGFLWAIALGTFGFARLASDDADADSQDANAGTGKLLGIVAILAGLAAPALWIAWRFPLGGGSVVGVTVVGIVTIALALITASPNRRQALSRRAAHTALGALLVFLPIWIGQTLTQSDYNESREVIAEEVIAALHQHYLAEQTYPDDLQQLVEGDYIEAIPRPRVGFQLVYDLGYMEPYEFDYRGFGTSYVLEFVSTEWIQCAYNPPYLDEYGNEYEEYEDEEEEAGGDIWTCTTSRPEFF